MNNVFSSLPEDLDPEVIEDLLKADRLRIERIISHGHSSPEPTSSTPAWYDQEEHEWVLVLEGEAIIELEEGGREIRLKKGDYLNIPAHCRHRVSWTHPDQRTIWLAVFYR